MPLMARALPKGLAWRPRIPPPLTTSQCPALTSTKPIITATIHSPPKSAARTHRATLSTSTLQHRKQSAIAQRLPDPERQPQRFRDFDLEGKVFVVTGGGRGLGLTLAEVLVEAGGKAAPQVYCLDRLPAPVEDFHHCRDRLAQLYGGTLSYEKVDVRDAADLDHVIARIADENGGLHGLVAAAGVQKVVPALEYPPEAIDEMMQINYKGVYLASVSCARQMIKHNTPGAICLIASMSGLIANKGFTSSVYNSSKAAVCQMARSLAMEWGKVVDGRPIRVNALCPGNIMTPMVKKNFDDDPGLREIWERENMLGRISDPSEYRGAALFLLSDASSFMTGSQLIIDGGYTAW